MKQIFWDDVYAEKKEKEVSWFQDMPNDSLALISEANISLDSPIIDIGGGESRLVDELLNLGHKNLSVLDISPVALEKTRLRLGERADHVKFLAADVTKFLPREKYDLWHDRATFHFLTTEEEVEAYLEVARGALTNQGNLIVSTFSKTGPEQCSGLKISQYADTDLKSLFGKYFINTRCFESNHVTPWGSTQSFVYCGFKKR